MSKKFLGQSLSGLDGHDGRGAAIGDVLRKPRVEVDFCQYRPDRTPVL